MSRRRKTTNLRNKIRPIRPETIIFQDFRPDYYGRIMPLFFFASQPVGVSRSEMKGHHDLIPHSSRHQFLEGPGRGQHSYPIEIFSIAFFLRASLAASGLSRVSAQRLHP
ncbi:hypothetical protein BJX66DRAFT_66564 [Aspergillus keveii]|uniref:Uncharacterized protein n=1 Tax=Aspergillus keveii TaxID=714993 RepID=A0ABR4FQ85_9EURO